MPDEDQLFLRPVDPPVAGRARGDLSAIVDDLDFIKRQFAQLPTRNEVLRVAIKEQVGDVMKRLHRRGEIEKVGRGRSIGWRL